MKGVVRLTIYEARWHGFARWKLSQSYSELESIVLDLHEGWCWRGPCGKFEEWQWIVEGQSRMHVVETAA